MKPRQTRARLRLKETLLALAIAAMATQVGGASAAPRITLEPPVAHVSTAIAPVPGERELLAWITSVLRGSPVPDRWALLIAGLTGVWAIGRRRIAALGNGTLDSYGLRRR
jgi:hypothetical protein